MISNEEREEALSCGKLPDEKICKKHALNLLY